MPTGAKKNLQGRHNFLQEPDNFHRIRTEFKGSPKCSYTLAKFTKATGAKERLRISYLSTEAYLDSFEDETRRKYAEMLVPK